jgi:hypothetical protein
MNKITLTARGREILSPNTLQGGETYWVGYFGLAYVPDQGRFSDKQTRLINDNEHGDYIYNLWQGDLVNEGHLIASDNLRKLTMYDRNLTSNFRYMYDDEKDCNRLVTWTTKDDSESGSSSYVREGYHIYNGITQGESNNTGDTDTESELPCPAPLFYAGGSASYGTAPGNPADFMETVSPDWPKCKVNNYDCPMVTPDMRAYPGTWAGATGSDWDWVPQNAGKYDTLPSYITRKTAAGEDGAESLDQYAKFLSVSNFNKEHGHVSAEGYNVGYQESCHNMSMVTRLFPIASYELTATSEPSTNDPNRSERGSAKSIKYVIRMDLKSAYQGVRAYLDTLTYQKSDTEGVEPEDIALYTSKKPNSFKFNRIGIYAVPVTIRHFYKEGDAANRKDCRATHYQMEISPDAKPELFAVMQVDEVCMSEDGSFGLSDYNTTFVLNLENVSDNTSLCTNPEVYYNLAENEAITWYQNQLIATAGLSEAVTNLGVNMAHMMNRLNTGNGNCGPSELTNVTTVSNETAQVNSDWEADCGVAMILNKPDVPVIDSDTGAVSVNGTTKGYVIPNQLQPAGDTTTPVYINEQKQFVACSDVGYSDRNTISSWCDSSFRFQSTSTSDNWRQLSRNPAYFSSPSGMASLHYDGYWYVMLNCYWPAFCPDGTGTIHVAVEIIPTNCTISFPSVTGGVIGTINDHQAIITENVNCLSNECLSVLHELMMVVSGFDSGASAIAFHWWFKIVGTTTERCDVDASGPSSPSGNAWTALPWHVYDERRESLDVYRPKRLTMYAQRI